MITFDVYCCTEWRKKSASDLSEPAVVVFIQMRNTPSVDIMGICLETAKKDNDAEEHELREGSGGIWFVEEQNEADALDGNATNSRQNGHVKFEMPKVPVIFVLGGPGSGKVTHCDNLADEKQGVVHVNMSDLLQQYAVGTDEIKDSNQLSSKTVAEVLMLEMKMSPAAKTFLISGYPRNMRDVVEYTDKMKTVSGVLLLSWKRASLERQIEYGAKLGHVVLGLARLELNNFYKHVVPVADFYDQRQMLVSINGERNPAEVYNDFRVAVLRIIGSQKTATNDALPNGKLAVGPATDRAHQPSSSSNFPAPFANAAFTATAASISVHSPSSKNYPPFVYVIGGPGSNKAALVRKVMRRIVGWTHISTGSLLRARVDAEGLSPVEAQNLRDTIAAGELVEMDIVNQILTEALRNNANANGIVLVGYPCDLEQLHHIEEEYDQHPPIILLDSSKLQLSRGRWDDNVGSFRKRLEMFRERTLPMLKVLDTEHRLTLIDGDTDTPEVEESFTIALFEAIQRVDEQYPGGQNNRLNLESAILQDLEDEASDITTSSKTFVAAHMANGFGPAGHWPPVHRVNNTGVVSVSHASGPTQRSSQLPRDETSTKGDRL